MTDVWKVDRPGFKRQMDQMMQLYGVTAEDLLLEEHRLTIRDVVKHTPPPEPRGKQKGEGAIESDLNKIFVGLDAQTMNELADMNLPDEIFNPEGDRIEQHHQDKRNRRGRVSNRRHVVTKRAGGRIEFDNRVRVRRSQLNAYMRRIKKHVGRLKAGWLAQAEKLGIRVNQYVKRHRVEGSFRGSIDAFGNGSFTSTNAVPYGVAQNLHRIAEFTMAIRRRNLPRRLEFKMRKFAAEANRIGV